MATGFGCSVLFCIASSLALFIRFVSFCFFLSVTPPPPHLFRALDLSNNSLTGTVPSKFVNLPVLG